VDDLQSEDQRSAPLELRRQHQEEVLAFLRERFSRQDWAVTLPPGSGAETYFAQAGGLNIFIKLGVNLEYYPLLAALGLTPPVLAAGRLADGTSLLVQPKIVARKPSRKDFGARLERFAGCIRSLHSSPELKRLLPLASSNLHRELGLQSLARVQQKWEIYRSQVPAVAGFVDESLLCLLQQVLEFTGEGAVASHPDPCNANWLVAESGEIYLIDFDSLALDDPAFDLGAILWWYYPPELRPRFLELAGYALDQPLQNRMQVRMALHCLDILLPRGHSYDRFDPAGFAGALTDFKAAFSGKDNPQGYA
jgi:hypothetical protein